MIAENEIVLTCLLQLMAERGIPDKLVFKGGACLRKMFIGSAGRFSTDLDLSRVEERDHEDVVLAMMEAFEQPFHGIQFGVPDDSCYETRDGLSWGVNPVYAHDWNPGGQSEIRLQISRRRSTGPGTRLCPGIRLAHIKREDVRPRRARLSPCFSDVQLSSGHSNR